MDYQNFPGWSEDASTAMKYVVIFIIFITIIIITKGLQNKGR